MDERERERERERLKQGPGREISFLTFPLLLKQEAFYFTSFFQKHWK
jgi:hypothetical protein